MEPLEPGVVLAGRYRLDKKLGEGGMGVVWAAMHVVTRQTVALKLVSTKEDDGRIVKRFMREARAASAVVHPNVVLVYDVLELDERTPMMVMEMLHGESLGERLDREHKLPIGEVARILLPVVSALGTAHALGVVHRDVKPDNIFLSTTPEGIHVKVLDFGIAKLTAMPDAAATGTLTATDSLLGTPYYMAPEQVFGERDVDHRADVWALGIVAYECLSGRRPTEGENVGQILKIISMRRIEPIARVMPELPIDLATLVMRALSAERDDRPSLQEFSDTLGRYTDLRVRSFGLPRGAAPRPSAPNLAADTGPRVSVGVSDSEIAHAPTVESGQHRALGATATLDAGVTRPRKIARARWGALAIGGSVLVAAVVVSVQRLSARTTSPSATSASVVRTDVAVATSAPFPSATASAMTTASAVETLAPAPPETSARVRSASSTTIVHHTHTTPSATASITAAPPPTTAKTTNLGGVVEQTPY